MVVAGTDEHPCFKPCLSPQQMLALGIFGGAYFAKEPACWHDEIPDQWKISGRRRIAQTLDVQDPRHNAFGVLAGQSDEVWEEKGWYHPVDPCGWFQWYCRYWLGRRHEDDARQIKRWTNYARHRGMLRHQLQQAGAARGDLSACLKTRQSLIQWAYRPYPY